MNASVARLVTFGTSGTSEFEIILIRLPELPGSERQISQFLIRHQLTNARHHRPHHPRTALSLFAPTRLSLDGVRSFGEQASRPLPRLFAFIRCSLIP